MTRYAQVIIYNTPLDIDLTYVIPSEFEPFVERGQVVVVPLRNIDKIGFVVNIDEEVYPDAKPIKRVLDIRLPVSLLSTTRVLSSFYLTSWSKFLKETIPPELSTMISRVSWKKSIPKAKRKEIIENLPGNAPRQREVLEILYEKGSLSVSYLRRKLGLKNISSVIDSLIEKGYIEYLDKGFEEYLCEYERTEYKEDTSLETSFPEQFSVYTLNDLSIPEKVEFYLRLYSIMRNRGSVLYIFPNQRILERVKKRFEESEYKSEVIPYYSGLKKKIERKSWACIVKGKSGAFFSLSKGPFLPIKDLSLIVVDEEESLEYMTKTDPIYHLRKAALERARWENIPLILEAPKPSLFSYKGLLTGRYKKISFKKARKKRVKPLANVTILEKKKEGGKEFSSWFSYKIGYMYNEGKKQFIFVNRRGYASLVCKDCGYIFKCPHCDLPLIYFSEEKELRCPKCTYREEVPDFCPSCGGFNLVPWGEGVEKIEEIVKNIIPDAKVVTISSDKRPNSFLSSKDYDVIIGTSAAFGYFDLSDIDFIGVLSIDTMLSSGTYHAAEDTFLFLNFLRLNMKKGGEMIVETRYPEHRVFVAFARDDAESFYRREILYRKELFYPPFSNMVKFILGAKVNDMAKEKLATFKDFLKNVIIENRNLFLDITGPYFRYKERDYYFWELLFKIEDYDSCASIFKGAYLYFFKKEENKDYKIKVEVDPDIL